MRRSDEEVMMRDEAFHTDRPPIAHDDPAAEVAHDPEVARRESRAALERYVQRKAAGSAREDVHDAAARGVASPTTGLPFADEIQASFGPAHDVSTIRAHVGGDA